ncbi:MAG: hypothetical protein N4A50_01155 [Vallitalea sp.]|jgi:hypothetical protein|nr:hypothetical protein [Vallitalea sp.]
MKNKCIITILSIFYIIIICVSCIDNDSKSNDDEEQVVAVNNDIKMGIKDSVVEANKDDKLPNSEKEIKTEETQNTAVSNMKDSQYSNKQELDSEGIKIIKPTINDYPDLSEEAIQNWKAYLKLKTKFSETDIEYNDLTVEEKDLIEMFEPFGSPWDIGPPGCSWYCGGGLYKVTATSNLEKQGEIDYIADRAHDFSVETAWVEGVKGYGEGESISYYFEPNTAYISAIAIYNGYAKNDYLYNSNGRVKKLALYVNGRIYAILDLEDTWKEQVFMVEPLKSTIEEVDLVLTFEIQEVYEGDKWEDTCIAEINFSGEQH